jgi:hypothetical protein
MGAAAVAIFLALVVPAGWAGAFVTPSAGSTQTLWAYGAVRNVGYSGTTAGGWQYQWNATFGFSVILNQTNTSATTIELSANRTMGAILQFHYCYPNCQSPKYYGNVTDHVYETLADTANLTTAGSVTENGGSVAAIALNNSASQLRANVTEVSSSYLPLSLGVSQPVVRSHYLGAQVTAQTSLDLSPSLGILPESLATAQTWSSQASFDAQVAAQYAYYSSYSGPLRTVTVGPLRGNLSTPATGTVTVNGSFSPANEFTLGGVAYPEVALAISGPFALFEGFLLVPRSADLFEGGQPWSADQNGSTTASMSFLDARSVEDGHLGIGGSAWVFEASSLGPTSAVSGLTGVTETAGPAADTESAPPTTVQGLPENVATAQAQQNCLLTGAGCPGGAGPASPSALRGIAGLLGILVVVIVVIAVVVLVTERRRMPPPVYPNAALYPPIASFPPPPGAPTGPPPTPDEDPLRNLW